MQQTILLCPLNLRDLFFSLVSFVFAVLVLGCAKPQAKHYALHGKIMSVDKLGHELIVDHDARMAHASPDETTARNRRKRSPKNPCPVR